jgi:hypothetical protein
VALLERSLRGGLVRTYRGRLAILLAAVICILAVAIMASGARTVTDESVASTSRVNYRSGPPTCRHAVVVPKRGRLCTDRTGVAAGRSHSRTSVEQGSGSQS